MPKIIKNAELVEDSWILVNDKEISNAADLPSEGELILPLSVWQATAKDLADRTVAVWLDSDEAPEAIKDVCNDFPLIAINFPAFADGRGYSYANVLRIQYGYTGELRAIGDVLRDQLFYMKRVGFNSFAMREDQKLEEAIANLADFTRSYQAAHDNPEPLFQKR